MVKTSSSGCNRFTYAVVRATCWLPMAPARDPRVAQSIQQRAQEVLGPVPFILMLNKRDLPWAVSEAQLNDLRASGWDIRYTSAKTGEGVEESFESLAKRMLEQS